MHRKPFNRKGGREQFPACSGLLQRDDLVPTMEHRDKTDLPANTRMAKINERFANGLKSVRSW